MIENILSQVPFPVWLAALFVAALVAVSPLTRLRMGWRYALQSFEGSRARASRRAQGGAGKRVE